MNDVRPAVMPKARKDRLIIKELPDETLVYDLDSDRAHCLNSTAAVIWRNCDGKKSINDLETVLASETQMPIQDGIVWLSLEELNKFGLLTDAPTTPPIFKGMNRRQLMRQIGMGALVLPVIMSISAPTQAQAGPCVPTGQPCNPPTNCCVGGINSCPSGSNPKICN